MKQRTITLSIIESDAPKPDRHYVCNNCGWDYFHSETQPTISTYLITAYGFTVIKLCNSCRDLLIKEVEE